jgi:hypothetical protein
MTKYFLIFILIAFFLEPLLADVWLSKRASSYTGRGGDFVAEIFPVNSRLKNNKPICFFYRENFIDYEKEEYDPRNRFSLVWDGELINDTAPNAALVSPNGYLVTLDEHAQLGKKHSLVLYNKNGDLVRDFNLTDLIPQDYIKKIPRTITSVNWRYKAKYYFCNPANKVQVLTPSHLYIVLKFSKSIENTITDFNKVIEIELENGACSYGDLSDYTLVDSLHNSKSIVNENAMVWETSLENSSITELLNCLNK